MGGSGNKVVRAASVLALLVTHPARAQFDVPSFERRVTGAMAAVPTPGLAVAIVRDDRIFYEKGFGVRRSGGAARVDPNTVFGIGSCTKTFATGTVAALVDAGKLGWDDKVVRYLPWFATNDPAVTRELTIRDLLAFRTGLYSGMIREVARDRISYLSAIRYTKPKIPFRAGWAYTNDTMTLAGEVVRAVSGQPWDAYARDRLWRPLGMSRTNADHRVARAMSNHATPHVDRVDGAGVMPIPWLLADAIVVPSVGMNTSVHDLAAWLKLQLGEGRVGGTQILSPAAVREMHRPVTPGSRESQVPVDGAQYALGWESYRYKDRQVLHKEGNIYGFKCAMTIVPERRFGIVTLINSDHPGLLDIIHREALDAELGGERQDVTELAMANDVRQKAEYRDSAARLLATRRPVAAGDPASAPARYVGSYVDDGRIGPASITLAGGRLALNVGRLTFDLEKWGPDRLRGQARWPFMGIDDPVWWGVLVDLKMENDEVSGISLTFPRTGGEFSLRRARAPN